MEKFKVLLSLILLFTTILSCDSSRILGIFPFACKSHNAIFETVMTNLAKRGHQVDVISHYQPNYSLENYTTIIKLHSKSSVKLPPITDFIANKRYSVSNDITLRHGNQLCQLLAIEKIQNLIKNPPNNPPYDLVITEAFGASCFMGFGHLLNVPVIAISSSLEFPWHSNIIGNADNPAFVSHSLQGNFNHLRFTDRLINFVVDLYHKFKYDFLTEHNQTMTMRKYLSPNIPDIRTIEKSVALTLVNSDYIVHGVKPVTPGLVHIAGIHIDKNNTFLPPDLQNFMDESVQGVICVSFGSILAIETLPYELIKELFQSFSKVNPIRVLMKVENTTKLPPGLPGNIKTVSWLPQFAILGHKNTKLFINHGGLLGSLEALYHGIPTISVPVFSEQFRNVASMVAKNISIKIDVSNLTATSLDEALEEVLQNPIYRKNAKYYSKLFRDKPMSPVDTAMFWIEYVIRNGPNSLKSPALDLKWWELRMLDVFGFLLSSLILLFILFYKFFCLIFNQCSCYFTVKRKLE